ncbi:DUF3152 domain-containing protein [Streptomyces sp. NPDC045431]|uniref:DUF3152 domain-containing protein n=1 Tax=Streptomyces sp. NPDC045431 TaxID=3155613 RepID=UPI00340FFFCD
MGRHSRKGSSAASAPAVPAGSEGAPAPAERPAHAPGAVPASGAVPGPGVASGPGAVPGPGTGRRRKGAAPASPASPPPWPYETPGAYEPPRAYADERHQAPHARGGHPEHPHQEQPARYGDWQGAPRTAPGPRSGVGAGARIPGPRREFVEAFDQGRGEDARRTDQGEDRPEEASATAPKEGRSGKGRTVTGIAAAAVTTVLAIVVAGQVTGTGPDLSANRPAGEAAQRDDDGSAPRSDRSDRADGRAVPSEAGRVEQPAAPATYEQLMTRQFPMDPALKGSGAFEVVPGFDKPPGRGEKVRYRVDVEKGLGLDARLFAEAVHKTLNDDRSWAHGGAMAFERVSSGEARFVVTLASPGTTGVWCAKSGLDTTIDNVSCDSAATERVMINAYRWAQGSETYGADAMYAYRQMLINHEVGHRLGHNHVTCRTPGALAPVMQQQTKSLEIDGVKCRPNPWVYPGDS